MEIIYSDHVPVRINTNNSKYVDDAHILMSTTCITPYDIASDVNTKKHDKQRHLNYSLESEWGGVWGYFLPPVPAS